MTLYYYIYLLHYISVCFSLTIIFFPHLFHKQQSFLSQQSNQLKLLLITYSYIMPSQSPLVLGTENLSCTQRACPGTHPSPHSGQQAPFLGAQGSTTPSDPLSLQGIFLSHTGSSKSIQTVLQPVQPHGSQICSDTHHQCPGPQPLSGAPVPTVSAALQGGGDRGKGDGAAETEKRHCGVCGHLLLAVVLVVFSPLVAVGVCMADILT